MNALTDCVSLSNGVKMPVLGAGTWRIAADDDAYRTVRMALELGYRHIDTAAVYENERGVGRAIRESGIPREQIFLTTKLWNESQRRGTAASRQGFEESLRKLGLDYVDLYLIHWPVKERIAESWKLLEEFYASGKAKAIGVSNFLIHHLETLKTASVRPMVNQYEFHPYLLQPELLQYCKQNGIVPEAWSPLMKGEVANIAAIQQIAQRHGKTPAQVTLRWDLQHGVVTIPKSVRRERLDENAAIFDFVLSDEEMRAIDALDQNKRVGAHPDHFEF